MIKKYDNIDRETGSDAILVLLDEVNRELYN